METVTLEIVYLSFSIKYTLCILIIFICNVHYKIEMLVQIYNIQKYQEMCLGEID